MKQISALLLSILLAVSCNSGRSDANRIVIASLRGPSSVAMLQLIDSLANEDAASIEVKIFDEPLLVRKMMLEGKADFALLPTTMAALSYNRGIDYRLAAVPLWGTLYLCGTHIPASLNGERVFLMAKGMTPDVMFRHMLVTQGLRPEMDVTLDYRFPTHIDLANAAIADLTPLCVLSEPYLSLALKRNPRLQIIAPLSDGTPETAFLVRGTFAEGSPEIVRSIVEAYRRSGEWVKANPEQAAQLAVDYGILPDAEAALSSIPRSNIDVVPAGEAREALDSYLKLFFDMDPRIIGDKMPDEKFYL